MDNLFYTHSFNLAAYLLMDGHEVIGKQKSGNKNLFYFKRTKELNDVINKYNNDLYIKKFITSFKKIREISNSD